MPKEQTGTDVALRPMEKLKLVLSSGSVREQFDNALKENSGAFVASIIDLYGSDTALQKCNPNDVVMECLKAATLHLPISKQLGFAYVIPYGSKPNFQLGYRGYIQLAMRTGQYLTINADKICEGVKVERDILTGDIKFSGAPASDKAIGYFAHFRLLNGFTKTLYMTSEEVIAHAKRYSKSYTMEGGAWKTSFEQMAIKTPLRLLLSHYGIMSTEMQRAVDTEEEVLSEIAENANKGAIIDVDPVTGEVIEKKADPIGDAAKRKLQAEKDKKCCGCGSTDNLSQDEHGNWFCEKCYGKPKAQAPF
jgi:recombination protein RecT